MSELEIIATFDTPETAKTGTKLLNHWFTWIMDGSSEDSEEVENLFDDFGIPFEDYSLDRDTDTDWSETPEAYMEGNKIVVGLDSKTSIDTIRELFEAMGAYDVNVSGEEG